MPGDRLAGRCGLPSVRVFSPAGLSINLSGLRPTVNGISVLTGESRQGTLLGLVAGETSPGTRLGCAVSGSWASCQVAAGTQDVSLIRESRGYGTRTSLKGRPPKGRFSTDLVFAGAEQAGAIGGPLENTLPETVLALAGSSIG